MARRSQYSVTNLLPCSFTVVIPHMIQSAIDKSELPLLAGSIEAVSPTQVRFGFSTELKNSQQKGVTLDAFPLELYNPESESQDTIVTLEFPEQFLEKDSTTAIEVEPQTLEIHSQTETRLFLSRAFQAEQTSIGARGSTLARVFGRSYPVTIDKEVSLDGLHNLEGMKVDTLVPMPPGGMGANISKDDPLSSTAAMSGLLTVPNPSKLRLALGNVTYNVYNAGMLLGESHTHDLHLEPGDQVIPYEGTLNVDGIVDAPHNNEAFGKIMETLTDDGRVPFDIIGNAAYANGEHIEYLDDVLPQIKLRVTPCMKTTSDAIPKNKQSFALMTFIPIEKTEICDPSAPIS